MSPILDPKWISEFCFLTVTYHILIRRINWRDRKAIPYTCPTVEVFSFKTYWYLNLTCRPLEVGLYYGSIYVYLYEPFQYNDKRLKAYSL